MHRVSLLFLQGLDSSPSVPSLVFTDFLSAVDDDDDDDVLSLCFTCRMKFLICTTTVSNERNAELLQSSACLSLLKSVLDFDSC